ncbi:MAG: hypothetical protein LBJ72_06375, partial [Dysgonamonadaceae bacterium]|nr:hypothetical protein [Dysgonamonadaceae bacterium]
MRAYIQKYGEKEHSPYFRGLLWNVNDENITLSEVELQTDNSFMANLENRNQISLKVKSFNAKNTDEAVQYFTDLQQATINLDNQGSRSQLHYCLCFPLYDRNVWNDVKACISILNAVERPIEIDLFGLSYDLAKLFAENTEDFDIKQAKKITAETLKNVLEIKKKPANNIIHFIVLQNCQTAGVALNLSTQTFIKVMGEFALLCIESYDELFGLVQPNSELQGLGLSVLSLDKYYYVEYLLHKAYLLALEREGIQGIDKIEEVDINLATNKAQEILKN